MPTTTGKGRGRKRKKGGRPDKTATVKTKVFKERFW